MTNQDKNFELLANMMDSLNAKSSMEDVAKYLAQMVEMVTKAKDLTEQEIQNLRNMFNLAISEAKGTNSEQFATLKARLMSYCENEMTKMMAEHDKKMMEMDAKMDEVQDGQDADEEKVIQLATEAVLAKIPPPKELESETGDTIIEKVNTSEEQIDSERVKGLNDEIKRLGNIPRGSGGNARGLQLYVNSVKKGLAQYVDIIPGSNITITDSLVNGLHSITFTSTGGTGFTQLSATETPNGSLAVFTFSGASAQPSFLVVDNVWLKPTTAMGTVNWTWNNGTKKATLSVPATDDIWGVA